jgi:hypothetical protein
MRYAVLGLVAAACILPAATADDTTSSGSKPASAAPGTTTTAGTATAPTAAATIAQPHPAVSGSLKETPWPVGKRGKYGFWWDHYKDSNDVNYDDFSGFISYKQVYAQVWSGDYTDGVEFGGYVRDHRKGTYGGFYRWRDGQDHVLQFDTGQPMAHGLVWVGSVRFIHVIPEDPDGGQNQVQFGTGLDWYHGDYDFGSFRAISDPREGGRWTFQFTHRFYFGESVYLEPGYLPRTDGTTNWFLRGKVKHFVWLVGDFNQFDFSDIERKQVSLGLEFPY